MKRRKAIFLMATLMAVATNIFGQESTNLLDPASIPTVLPTTLDSSSFYGLKIGMSEQDILKLYPKFLFRDRGPLRRSSEQLFFSDNSVDLYFDKDQNAIIDLTLIDDRLVNISVRWIPTSFEVMQSKLERVFGSPLFVEKKSYTTNSGEKFTNAVATWTSNNVTLVHYPHYEHIAQSRLLFLDKQEQKK